MLDIVKQLNFEVRSQLACYPALRGPFQFYLWRGRRKAVRAGQIAVYEKQLGPDTELMIDGFQGSANTHLVLAFKSAQSRPVRLIHHFHAPVVMIRALRNDVPVVLTVRDPKGSVVSLVHRWSYVTMEQALRSYVRFYGAMQPYADQCVITTFERTLRRTDEVIREVNLRHGTRFEEFVPTPENIEQVRGPMPTDAHADQRRALKRKRREAFATRVSPDLLARAEALYEDYCEVEQRHIEAIPGLKSAQDLG